MEKKKVVRVELRTRVSEFIKKSKRLDYKHGGFCLDEIISRTTVQRPAALLECGHYREDISKPLTILNAKSLSCWECERENNSRLKPE